MAKDGTLSDAFRERMTETKSSIVSVARKIGVTRQCLHRWLRDNEWPAEGEEEQFQAICDAFGLNGSDGAPLSLQEARRRYHFDARKGEKVRGRRVHASFKEAFADFDKQLKRITPHLDHVTEGIADLFSQMKDLHFLIVISASVDPFIHRKKSKRVTYFPAAVEAIRRGAYVLLIRPSPKLIEIYKKTYGMGNLHEHNQFVSGDRDLRNTVIERLKKDGKRPEQGKEYCEEHVLEIIVNEEVFPHFPYFVPGWTFSVFGEFDEREDTTIGVTFRTQSDKLAKVLWHPHARLLESRLAGVAFRLIEHELPPDPPPPEHLRMPREMGLRRLGALIGEAAGDVERYPD